MPSARVLFAFSLLLTARVAPAQEESFVFFPAPDTTGGKPLMQVLHERKSTRSFYPTPISEQMLGNLLWAAFGVNRPDGRRTAPSARNWQEISIYVLTADGLFLYDAPRHALHRLLKEDLRAKAGTQEFVASAPLNLVYVADMKKVAAQSADDAALYTGADCGFIAQNVYLYCASEGLGAVVRGLVDRSSLATALHLQQHQRILLTQTVGHRKKD